MISKMKKNEVRYYYIKKAVDYSSTALVLLSIYYVIITAYLSTDLTANITTYITIVSRISIFYLGSIITMSVYIYTKTYSMSTIQFASPVASLTMGLGVFCSFFSIITVPSKLYYPTPIYQNYFLLIFNLNWNFQMILSLLNIVFFLVATTIFILTLKRFIYSFNIDAVLNRNYIAVAKICRLKVNEDNNLSESRQNEIKPLTKKEVLILDKKLDVYNQNLLYLLTLKNEILTKKYLLKWTNVINNIQERIFYSSEEVDLNKKLYGKTLDLSNKIIIETADNITLNHHHKIVLKTIFTSIPLLVEENKKNEILKDPKKLEIINNLERNYIKNYPSLLKVCYIEMNKLIKHLYENQKNSEIFQKMSNNEVAFRSFTLNQLKYYKDQEILNEEESINYMEDLLLGMLFNIVNKNNNVDLPVVLSLLFESQIDSKSNDKLSTDNEEFKISFGTASVLEGLGNVIESLVTTSEISNEIQGSMFQKNVEEAEQVNSKIRRTNLSNKTIKYLIIVIIKANEIENYKAVGYLIKRLCNHLSFAEILDKLNELEEKIFDGGYRELILSKISLNEYSLKYCFDKTKILLFLQSYTNNKEIINEFKRTIEVEYKQEILETLKDKHKEYNMSCIKEKVLDSLEDKPVKPIGFIE